MSRNSVYTGFSQRALPPASYDAKVDTDEYYDVDTGAQDVSDHDDIYQTIRSTTRSMEDATNQAINYAKYIAKQREQAQNIVSRKLELKNQKYDLLKQFKWLTDRAAELNKIGTADIPYGAVDARTDYIENAVRRIRKVMNEKAANTSRVSNDIRRYNNALNQHVKVIRNTTQELEKTKDLYSTYLDEAQRALMQYAMKDKNTSIDPDFDTTVFSPNEDRIITRDQLEENYDPLFTRKQLTQNYEEVD